MAVTMIATGRHPKASAGTEIRVSNSCVRFFRESGWAAMPAARQGEPKPDESDALRAEYEAVSGVRADNRWKPETLRRKIDEARASFYMRRDMRAEED